MMEVKRGRWSRRRIAALTMMVMGGAVGMVACASDEGGGGGAGTPPGPVIAQLSQVGEPLKGFATGRGDDFGLTLSISNDTVAVGLPDEDSGVIGDPADLSAPLSGAVWVFVRSGNGWAQQAYLKASRPRAFEWFGNSVALSGDTLVVGAPEPNGQGGGSAYVFTRSGGVWTEQTRLTPSTPNKDARFGWSVAFDGSTLLVGAPGLDVGVEEEGNAGSPTNGEAYVFVRSGPGWTQRARLRPNQSVVGDGFGASVGIAGGTAVIGAPFDDNAGFGVNAVSQHAAAPKAGAAYVFAESAGMWVQQTYLKASNTGTDDQFGRGVAVSGNLIAVGAPRESSRAVGINGTQGDNSAPRSGAVYLFTSTGSGWTQSSYIKPSNTGANDQFGRNLALSGKTLVIGANGEDSASVGINGNQTDNSGVNSGAAYVFVETGPATWSQQAYLKASETQPNRFFGTGVAVDGDKVGVGAPGIILSDSPADIGFSYIFQLAPLN